MSIEALRKLNDARVYCVAMPSHTSASLQLLDVSVFGPVKSYFKSHMDVYKREHPGQSLSKWQFPALVAKAWADGHSVGNIQNGAKAVGLWPLDMKWCEKNQHKFVISKSLQKVVLFPVGQSQQQMVGAGERQ